MTGVARWMYDTASQHNEHTLAAGLTHLFGDAVCPHCGHVFGVADRRETTNEGLSEASC
ncbi:hypothetical protein [Cryptosporangium aurantiacum]|uniref:Uncharacterized protein n=1 Tax=Cryptosporangium aurantiacum TaxID=134849 RepID=A0A1M7RL25_9ACTN|nr:hypothetical protein [Cryptosporangium aurantiacum]SHN47045.1 hypothetical protein SAMN05443668_1201 [Cryptosporangium aurantiacum]